MFLYMYYMHDNVFLRIQNMCMQVRADVEYAQEYYVLVRIEYTQRFA